MKPLPHADAMLILTPREREVARALADGHTVASTAALLKIDVRTAKSHTEHLMKRLGIHCRADLVRFVLKNKEGMRMPMKLWLVKRNGGGAEYDVNDAHVIRAESELKARAIAHEHKGGDEDKAVWLAATTTATEIPLDGPAEIILTDFQAG